MWCCARRAVLSITHGSNSCGIWQSTLSGLWQQQPPLPHGLPPSTIIACSLSLSLLIPVALALFSVLCSPFLPARSHGQRQPRSSRKSQSAPGHHRRAQHIQSSPIAAANVPMHSDLTRRPITLRRRARVHPTATAHIAHICPAGVASRATPPGRPFPSLPRVSTLRSCPVVASLLPFAPFPKLPSPLGSFINRACPS